MNNVDKNNGRRKTLAGLSPSQLNSRASVGPSRVTKDGKNSAKPLSGRPSLAARNPVNNAPAGRTIAGAAVQRRQDKMIVSERRHASHLI